MVTEDGERVFSVGEINGLSDRLLGEEFPSIWVQGELGQISRPQSGHWYFSLKDEGAELSCVMFRSDAEAVARPPKQGDSLRVRGRIGIYKQRGGFQMRANRMEFSGEGELWAAFLQLRGKLQDEGLFDEDRKRPIPAPPRHIAVITSPSGAAVRDVLVVLGRRARGSRVTLVPAKVQGEGAAAELCLALDAAAGLDPRPDAVLLCRGGGSLEDLWAFNEEPLVRAVAASPLPVVSAVGHESDTTLCDFAADLRAATPSVGAEILSQAQHQWPSRLQGLAEDLRAGATAAVERAGQRLDEADAQLQRRFGDLAARLRHRLEKLQASLRHPSSKVQLQRETLDRLGARLGPLALAAAQARRTELTGGQERAARAMNGLLARLAARLERSGAELEALSPMQVLQRGYALVLDDGGRLVADAAQVSAGDALHIQLAKGQVDARVEGASGGPASAKTRLATPSQASGPQSKTPTTRPQEASAGQTDRPAPQGELF